MKKTILTFANFLRRHLGSMSAALRMAWAMAKTNELHLLTFAKISTGEVTTRIVTIMGKQESGRLLYHDMVKVAQGQPNAIISTYPQNIVSYI